MWDKNKIDERKPNERYFWAPKKEMLLLVAKDKYKECPREVRDGYGTQSFKIGDPNVHGAYTSESLDYKFTASATFWKPFTM